VPLASSSALAAEQQCAEKIAPTEIRKTPEPLIAITNRRLKRFQMQRKRNLIRGVMSARQK
jgi:hypothetical protein